MTYAFNTSTGTERPYTYEGQTYLADTPSGRWRFFWHVDKRIPHLEPRPALPAQVLP